MSCETWIEALSALADGEDPGVDRKLIDAHLGRCAGCCDFAGSLGGLNRASSIALSPDMPDLSGRIVKLNAVADRAGTWIVIRVLLALVAIEIVVHSVPALVLGHDGMAMMMSHTVSHAARHYGALSVAYGVGLLFVAARPARARTMLPVAFVVALALAVTAVLDAIEGRVTLTSEAKHLQEILSLALVWLLTRPTSRHASATAVAPDLRLVSDSESPDHRQAG